MEHLWRCFEQFHLDENMRLASSGLEQKEFAAYLLSIGNGEVQDAAPNENPTAAETQIPLISELCSKATCAEDFCREIFPNLKKRIEEGLTNNDKDYHTWLMERAIICPTNKDVDLINDILLEEFPGPAQEYRSFDKLTTESQSEAHVFSEDLLNKFHSNGIPAHFLKLKVGAPVMLLTNLDPSRGHVNGTRYIIKALYPRVIYAEIAIGPYMGNDIMIPRIKFYPKDKTLPIEFSRKQFPLRLCFSVTSNKSQGSTLKHIGIFLRQNFFAHGRYCTILHLSKNNESSLRSLHFYLQGNCMWLYREQQASIT